MSEGMFSHVTAKMTNTYLKFDVKTIFATRHRQIAVLPN